MPLDMMTTERRVETAAEGLPDVSETQEEEEKLDRELDEVAATFNSSVERSSVVSDTRNGPERPLALTFEFPGWGIDIAVSSDSSAKRRKNIPVITRRSCSFPVHSCLNTEMPEERKPPSVSESWDWQANEIQVNMLPKEVWIDHILSRLDFRDLCSLMQASRWFNFIASEDEVWAVVDSAFASENHNDDCHSGIPRWIKVKNTIKSNYMKKRFSYISKAYDHLRSALNIWWDAQGPDCQYSSKTLHSLIQKMTAHNWTIVYEAFAVIFSERVDKLAGVLLSKLQSTNTCKIDSCLFNKVTTLDSHKYCMQDEGLVGKRIWQYVLSFWKQYKHWLTLVYGHCQYLNYEVMVESFRQSVRLSTPTVYDKGVICFRNQILLRYKLRSALQCGLCWLIGKDASDHASENDLQLLSEILHLLQEVDVADDFTLPSKAHTRLKLKRCFLLKKEPSKVLS